MRLLALAFLLLARPAAAQAVLDVADEMPEVVGGLDALQAAVVYPDEARQAGYEGVVAVQFVVDEEGFVVNPFVVGRVHPLLDQAALDALHRVRFVPGRHGGEPVAVRLVLPVAFGLDPAAPLAPPPNAGSFSSPDGTALHVDEMPEIVGGLDALVGRVVYPPEAEAAGIEGRVLISFVVDEAGAVEEAEVAEGAHPLLDAAALEAVLATPFRAGRRAGQAVKVRMVLPITFELPAGRDRG